MFIKVLKERKQKAEKFDRIEKLVNEQHRYLEKMIDMYYKFHFDERETFYGNVLNSVCEEKQVLEKILKIVKEG